MNGVLSSLSVGETTFLGLIGFLATLMVYGIRAIRHEIRAAGRIEARSVRLRTTEEQRTQWRRAGPSRDLLDLLDDIDTLWRLVDADDGENRQRHREAVSLSRMSRHVPVRTILIGTLLLAGVVSAALMVVTQGPSNPIP